MLVDFSYHPQIHDWVWIYFFLKEENAWDIILELTKVDFFLDFLSPDPKRIGGYSDQPGVRPSVRLSVCLSVRRQKLVRSITFIPFEIF